MRFWSRLGLAALVVVLTGPALGEQPKASGTGFVVTSDGWLVTNAHVVEGCSRIEVKGAGGIEDRRLDTVNDLALVKVSKDGLRPLPIREQAPKLGEELAAMGFPLAGLLSDAVKITTGNVSSLAGIGNDSRYLQVSAPIQPGNSGGPLLDHRGEVIGVATGVLSKAAAEKIGVTPQNVNFAIRGTIVATFLQSQGISVSITASSEILSTADLAERVAPSVFQILCFGNESLVRGDTDPTTANAPPPSHMSKTLLHAPGYDAIGFDYRSVRGVSFSICIDECQADPACQAITYNALLRACMLKNDAVALIRNDNAQAAYTAEKATDVIVSKFSAYSNVDIPGGDYRRITKSTYLGCFLDCVRDNRCRAFSYVPKKRDCWLKDVLGSVRPMRGVELGLK